MSTGADHVVPVVGLEIHAELRTRTKLFCRCPNQAGAPPNTHVCPVCLGLPGALPVLSSEAVRLAVLAGLALEGTIGSPTKWDRKSYAYPDLPKNYQISQYDLPICQGGHLDIELSDGTRKRVRLIRAHLEEDAGKSFHEGRDSAVDLNRAGVPLLEIVSRPEMSGSQEASLFAREVRRLLRWIGVCEGNMEQGQIRFEPNINLHIDRGGRMYRTPITEVKNLNSFRSLETTIAHEIERQYAGWLRDPEGYTIEHAPRENRGYDADRGITVFQREKEEAHDYRYFPDPDLGGVDLDPGWVDALRQGLGELPAARSRRYREVYGLSDKDAAVLTQEPATGALLDGAVGQGGPPRRAAALLTGAGARLANERGGSIADLGLQAGQLAELARLVDTGELTTTAANTLLGSVLGTGESPRAVALRSSLLVQAAGPALEGWVREALEGNPKAVADVRSQGKNEEKAFGFLVGQVMQRSRGAASPPDVERLLRQALYG